MFNHSNKDFLSFIYSLNLSCLELDLITPLTLEQQKAKMRICMFWMTCIKSSQESPNRIIIKGLAILDQHMTGELIQGIPVVANRDTIDYFKGEEIPDNIRAIPYLGFGISQARFIKDSNNYYLDKQPNVKAYFNGFEQYINDNMQK